MLGIGVMDIAPSGPRGPPPPLGGREGRSPRRGFRGEIHMRSSWHSLAGFGAAAPRRCCRRTGPWLRIETGSLASIRTRLAGSVGLTWCMILILVSCLKGVERRYLVLALCPYGQVQAWLRGRSRSSKLFHRVHLRVASGGLGIVVQGFVNLFPVPEGEHQHGKLSGGGYYIPSPRGASKSLPRSGLVQQAVSPNGP